MSKGAVYRNEMNAPDDFDDAVTEALLAGHGHEHDPGLADVLADLRVAYTQSAPAVGALLSAFLARSAPAVPAPPPRHSWFERLRSSMVAKIGAATTAAVAATGGLAVANALPAPLQDTMSHLGIGAPAGRSNSSPTVEQTTTTVAAGADAPAIDSATGHGSLVSGIAHDRTDGCNHGGDVSRVASDGRSRHDEKQVTRRGTPGVSCGTTTTTAGNATAANAKSHEDANTAPRNNHGESTGTPSMNGSDTTPTSRPLGTGGRSTHTGD
jgi:hypothetical protein